MKGPVRHGARRLQTSRPVGKSVERPRVTDPPRGTEVATSMPFEANGQALLVVFGARLGRVAGLGAAFPLCPLARRALLP